jgi:hypothetical protein
LATTIAGFTLCEAAAAAPGGGAVEQADHLARGDAS